VKISEAAATIQRTDRALAALEPVIGRAAVQQAYDHQGGHRRGTTPLLVSDGWEPAYYLQYVNDDGNFFDAVWQVLNWNDVAGRLSGARRLEA
jgi:superoxide dismutase, Fe-Mn family